MPKNVAILSGLVVLALAATLGGALSPKQSLAGGSACSGASKTEVSKASTTGGAGCCADKAGMKAEKAGMDASHCAASGAGAKGAACCPIDRAAFEKQAPGTKYDFQTSSNGATLTITAASAQYVAAVQTLAASRFETMKTQLASQKTTCTTSPESCPAHGSMSKASLTSGSDSHAPAKTSAAGSGCVMGDKASMKAEKGSAGCPSGASMTSASGLCPEIGMGMCCSDCAFEKTATGARITWSSTKPEVIKSVQAAASHMKTCMATASL